MKCPVCGVVNSTDAVKCAQCKSDLEIHHLIHRLNQQLLGATREDLMATENMRNQDETLLQAGQNVSNTLPSASVGRRLPRWLFPLGCLVSVSLILCMIVLTFLVAQQSAQLGLLVNEVSSLRVIVSNSSQSKVSDADRERALFLKVVESLSISTELLQAERIERHNALQNQESDRENYVTRDKTSSKK